MEYRIMGRSGLRVSAIGMGCEGFIGKSEEETRRIFDYAIDHGVNFMDLYSPNPAMRQAVGRALGERRNEFILQGHLCTVWEDGQYLRTREPEKLAPAFELQLRELGTDYLDVGMIHYVDAMDDLKEVMEGPVMAFARRLKAEGRIRCIGMSSHNPQVAIEAVKSDLIDVLMFSINPCYDMQPASEDVEELWAEKNYAHALQNIDPQRERLYELCEQRGVGINVMKVYGGGDLLSEKNSPFGRAFTAVQCLEYALSRPGVASIMTGIRSQEELQQALAWCNATAEERDYTQVMQGMTLFSWKGHCMYCGHCAPCSAGIDIAMVNKLYNLTEAEGMVPETVREHYKALNVHASDCIGCGLCEPRCPFGVEIIQSMEKAAGRFGY